MLCFAQDLINISSSLSPPHRYLICMPMESGDEAEFKFET